MDGIYTKLGIRPNWNDGIMGSGIMRYWVSGNICFDKKIKNG